MKPSHLSDHLGYWLRKLSNHVSSSFAERLGKHEISVSQWVVLRVIFDHEALALKEVVSRVGVDQGSLSRMVDRLVARNLIVRKGNPEDRREVAISLSAEGRKLVPKLAAEADENDRAFFSHLSDSQKKKLLATIHTLLERNGSATTGMPLE